MDDWIDYYDSTHTIYASRLHRDLHFQLIAKDIIGYIPSPDAVVLDYACGEALSAARVADACGKLYLAEPAPGVRGRLIRGCAQHQDQGALAGRPAKDGRKIDRSRGHELGRPIYDAGRAGSGVRHDAAAVEARRQAGGGRYPAPRGRHAQGRARIVALRGDPRLPEGRPDRAGLDRAVGLPAIARKAGLQRYSETEMAAKLAASGFSASRAHVNIGHNPWRMTFVARHTF